MAQHEIRIDRSLPLGQERGLRNIRARCQKEGVTDAL
jgi:hypothetical protein